MYTAFLPKYQFVILSLTFIFCISFSQYISIVCLISNNVFDNVKVQKSDHVNLFVLLGLSVCH